MKRRAPAASAAFDLARSLAVDTDGTGRDVTGGYATASAPGTVDIGPDER